MLRVMIFFKPNLQCVKAALRPGPLSFSFAPCLESSLQLTAVMSLDWTASSGSGKRILT